MNGSAEAGPSSRPLSLDEYKRYGRQMIMPEWGLPGQLKLKKARVAVVGAGGLGCPVLQYLAGAGAGHIGIFDHDTVDISNLHRQILHSIDRVGMNKAQSAAQSLRSLNPHILISPFTEVITPDNATTLLASYEIIVDCTDRPLTRYLLNDTAVLSGITLVSGAAISSAGQWGVYGGATLSGKRRGCYRCVWPAVVGDGGGKCEEMGVWGPVTGMVGTSMASEVLKLIIGNSDPEPLLHMFHLGGNPLVRTLKLRPPSVKCVVCGPNSSITDLKTYDYNSFCSGRIPLNPPLSSVERLSPKDAVSALAERGLELTIIDTRPPVEFDICSIPGSTNIPLRTILADPGAVKGDRDILFVCRQGNDSLIAAEAVSESVKQPGKSSGRSVMDMKGGLVAWAREVDPAFPIY